MEKQKDKDHRTGQEEPASGGLIRALFPLWGTVLLLVITRVPQLGIKPLLRATEPAWEATLGSLGQFRVSASLVIQLQQVFGESGKWANWRHDLLYVPSVLPFGLVCFISFLLFGMSRRQVGRTFLESAERMVHPIIALLGALVMVNLLMLESSSVPSCTGLIGRAFADALGAHWRFFAPYLGALGSFFSGSNTVSNLTFGSIQNTIGLSTGLDRLTVLALQSTGGAMGNMVCIHNIVAVCSVLGIESREGFILKRTVLPMLLYGIIAALVGLLL